MVGYSLILFQLYISIYLCYMRYLNVYVSLVSIIVVIHLSLSFVLFYRIFKNFVFLAKGLPFLAVMYTVKSQKKIVVFIVLF